MAGLASAGGDGRAPAVLPRFMAGGPGNPLGARAMYLGTSQYRIHGTNDPSTIGKFVSENTPDQ
jgi:lipoprotein-anchoring transpeptidase ErfK/SrfK